MDVLTTEADNNEAKKKKNKPVYFAKDIKEVVDGKDLPFKSLTDMIPYLKKEFSERFGGKTDHEIRQTIIAQISAKKRVYRGGPFVSYSNEGLVDVLTKEADKEAKKKKNKAKKRRGNSKGGKK